MYGCKTRKYIAAKYASTGWLNVFVGVLMLMNEKTISTIVQEKIKKFISLLGAEK